MSTKLWLNNGIDFFHKAESIVGRVVKKAGYQSIGKSNTIVNAYTMYTHLQ